MPLLLHVSALLTAACVAGLWQGLAIVAMGAALCALIPRASAGPRHTLLVTLFAGALVLPWVNLQRQVSALESCGLQMAHWVAAGLAFLWWSTVTLRAFQLYLAWRHLCMVRRDAMPIQVRGSAEFCGGRRRAVLFSSSDVDSPSTLGFGSPRLLLPNWMVPVLSEVELQLIALYECEHLRRGDEWMNLLLQAEIMLSPLNAALLWSPRVICVQRELAADAAADQPLATAVPTISFAAISQGRADMAFAAQTVTASFHVKSGRAAKPRSKQSRSDGRSTCSSANCQVLFPLHGCADIKRRAAHQAVTQPSTHPWRELPCPLQLIH